MRTRKKKLSDYGVPVEDGKKILALCRMANKKERQELMQICISSAPCGIEVFVYWSLVLGMSYDEILKKEYIAATKDDFYGYRRKAMAQFYDWMRLTKRMD